jgi:hypothetical protein
MLLLSACAPGGLDTLQQDLTRVAQEQVMKTLASHYTRELSKGVATVVAGLAEPGGYLNNPIARILLPPPLTMALGVVRDLKADPQASLLSVLMNQAAEQAIPGAAPILQAVLMQITPTEARQLLDGDKTAGTEALKARTSTALQAVLGPIISDQLAASGAMLVYKEILETYPTKSDATPTEDAAAPIESVHESVSDLGRYVTEQAVAGMFNVLGDQETFIRNNFDDLTGGMLQGLGRTPAMELQKSR